MIVNLIIWIVVGAIAGWLASMMMKTNRGQSFLEDVVVGIIGGLLGGFIVSALGIGDGVDGINIGSVLVAFLGAVVLLASLKAIRGTAQV